MRQTRSNSAIEALVNVASGFVVAWLITHFMLPVWGFEASIQNTTNVTLIYTAASLARVYTVRRIFNNAS